MKTSLIAYRVADFLKQHPPFQTIRIDDLLPLAQSGRVAFHTEDELVCRQDQPCKPWFWVIQQGSVELIDEPAGSIRDLLTAGDIFGVDGFAERQTYSYSARTTCDVILYALDTATLAGLRHRSGTVDRYLRALLSVQAVPVSAGQIDVPAPSPWLPVSRVTEAILKAHLVCCGKQTSIGEVAAAMLASNCHVSAITSAAGFPEGIVTDAALQNALAAGIPGTIPVEQIMQTQFPVTPPGFSLEDSILRMTRERESFLVITRDGSNTTPVEGVITETTVQLLSGISPSLLVRRAREAGSIDELTVIRDRVYAFVSQYLHDSSAVGWFSGFLTAFLNSLTLRLLELCRTQLELEGYLAPPVRWCWLFFGTAARGELLTPVAPCCAFAFEDAGGHSGDAAWFDRLGQRVIDGYKACGLATSTTPGPFTWLALSLDDWKDIYRRLLQDPLGEHIHERRVLFDFQVAAGDAELAEELRSEIRILLTDAAAAIALLGNDCLESLPPLTLFENLVVDMDGAQRPALDISRTALEPLADVGRVFAMASGESIPTGTIDRLTIAARQYPQHAALMLEASEAYRVLLLQRCRTGIQECSDGSTLYPVVLSRYEQLLLKSAFRSVLRIMEFTYTNTFSLTN